MDPYKSGKRAVRRASEKETGALRISVVMDSSSPSDGPVVLTLAWLWRVLAENNEGVVLLQ